jgi:hypothetical protein
MLRLVRTEMPNGMYGRFLPVDLPTGTDISIIDSLDIVELEV